MSLKQFYYHMKLANRPSKGSNEKIIQGYVIYLDKLLGRGAFGAVYRGMKSQSKLEVAVKVLDKLKINADQYMKEALKSEIKILQSIKSENTVALYDVLQSQRSYYLIQQLCDGDLDGLIQKSPKRRVPEPQAIQILKEICNGFLALVRQGIVHRDMKPANILISKKHAKLADFGFSKRKFKDVKMHTFVGTPLYMSPQVLKGQLYTSKCDIWAVGAIFYEILHGRPPWSAATQYQLIKAISKKEIQIQKTFGQKSRDFISRCLQKEESKRISWDQLFLHPIFDNYFKSFQSKNEHFENKLKGIMSDLRFMIHNQNIDLKQLFQMLGFQQKSELDFNQFSKLLKVINATIISDQIVYVFQKLDTNKNGKVGLKQLENEMEKNHISLKSLVDSQAQQKTLEIGKFLLQNVKIKQQEQEDQTEYRMSVELESRMKKAFKKLYKVLSGKKLTLYKVVLGYDQNKNGKLQFNQFVKIILKIDSSFNQDQLKAIFTYIDKNKSNSVEFDEINQFYCKVNGIPEALQLPEQYLKDRTKYRKTM